MKHVLYSLPRVIPYLLSMMAAVSVFGVSGDINHAPHTLGANQVVANLIQRNAERARTLICYEGRREYRLNYKGRNAQMVVEVVYRAPETKEFTIQSASGSKLVINRVFKKLIESELEAMTPDMQKRTSWLRIPWIARDCTADGRG